MLLDILYVKSGSAYSSVILSTIRAGDACDLADVLFSVQHHRSPLSSTENWASRQREHRLVSKALDVGLKNRHTHQGTTTFSRTILNGRNLKAPAPPPTVVEKPLKSQGSPHSNADWISSRKVWGLGPKTRRRRIGVTFMNTVSER